MANLKRPRVFLADDHSEFLEAEVIFLNPQFDVVGTTTDGPSLVSEVRRLQPDIAVIDVTLPGMTGIEAVHILLGSGSATKFVFLTIHASEEFVRACLEKGGQGYVVKSRMKSHLIPAIHAVLDGCVYVSPLLTGGGS